MGIGIGCLKKVWKRECEEKNSKKVYAGVILER